MKLVDQDVPGPKRDLVGYGRRIPKVTWPNGARVAVNLVVGYEEGSEYSHPAGDGRSEIVGEFPTPLVPPASGQRDLCVESIYEYGSRSGVWRLARIFDEFKVKTTFFASAVALERNLEVAEYIREAGHDVCAHGWRWEEVWRLSREEERQHMEWAIESLAETCGSPPLGWFNRCTPSAHTRELVVETGGFIYDSNAYNDDLPYFTEVNGRRHLIVPYSFSYNDMRFIFPGYSDPSSFVEYLRRGLDFLWDEGATYPKMMSIGLHPKWTGQAGRASALKEFLEYAHEKGDVWFAGRSDIANWWIDHHEEFET